MKIIKSTDRGFADFDWLKSFHSFSFGQYYNPKAMSFGMLRVINEDYVAKAKGFSEHGHKDMEILTYVISGELEHQDSMGNKEKIYPGEFQIMSAGTGIRHSEYNSSNSTDLHLMQIWLIPNRKNITPRYDQRKFNQSPLTLICSSDKNTDAMFINQDVDIYVSDLNPMEAIDYKVKRNKAWLQMINGSIHVNGQLVIAGDAVAVEGEDLKIMANLESKFLIFDLA